MKIRGGLIALTLFCGMIVPGCGPSLSEDELGQIVYEVPEVPGAEEPYHLEFPDKAKSQEGSDSNAAGGEPTTDEPSSPGG